MLPNYYSDITKNYKIINNKLVPNLSNKSKYVLHYENVLAVFIIRNKID